MFTSTDLRYKKKFPCDKCKLTYTGLKTLQNHKKTRHCDKCPGTFTRPKLLVEHVMKTHGLDIGPKMARIRGRAQSASQPAVRAQPVTLGQASQPVGPPASQLEEVQPTSQPTGPASQPMQENEDQPGDQSMDLEMEEEPPGSHSPPGPWPPEPPGPPGPSRPPESQGTQASQQLPLPNTGELPTLEEAHHTYIPTIIHIPKAARGEYTRVQTDLYVRLARVPEAHTLWTLLLIFPRVILHAGRGPRQADARSQAKQVLSRLSRWRQGEYRQLWDEAIAATKPPPQVQAQGCGGRQVPGGAEH